MAKKLRHIFWVGLVFGGICLLSGAGPATDPYAAPRQSMVDLQLKARGISDARVLAAMGKAPRHLFMPELLAPMAYEDHPLPIGSGQTISQPYIVALMTEWGEIKAGDKVLEVGTGSGYQAAVLAELADKVFSIDIRPELAEQAAKVLKSLSYSQVKVKSGDGYLGWPEQAPFDAILVTAAATRVPPALEKQLKEGGRLVIPLGQAEGVQTLTRFRKIQGKLRPDSRLAVRFVPLVEPGK
ncbi:MAG: protein-L-isoaspartate(D-aspartate) O-methyltransferase [Syntrophales bacterium]|nr:protein-L-isoaspartate(D-aspartate) O-methyltransferase [Syntrophales bacterium]MDD5642691.1 protein-L-isoaspartate(D-aspartate) O-methyltransferase [Syntrophales bacterium]